MEQYAKYLRKSRFDRDYAEASIEETQELLRLCGIAELYPKRKRDTIIYYGLLHRLDLFTINDRLFDENEDTLC